MLPEKTLHITISALNVVDSIIIRMELGHTLISLYLDLSKAFDTLDHPISINKLKYYGIQVCALDLIKNTYQIYHNV